MDVDRTALPKSFVSQLGSHPLVASNRTEDTLRSATAHTHTHLCLCLVWGVLGSWFPPPLDPWSTLGALGHP